MTDHGRGLDTPRDPELRERVANREEGRLGPPGIAEGFGGVFTPAGRGKEETAKVVTDGRLENARTAIDTAAEGRLRLVESACHAGILRTLSGKHESNRPIGNCLNGGESFRIPQQRNRACRIVTRKRNRAPIFKWPAAGVERICGVGQIDLRMFFEMRREPLRSFNKGRLTSRRNCE
jgi:hypothetical protein